MSRTGLILSALGLALASHGALPQVSPNGPEFQVNLFTVGNQWSPVVASDTQGNFVVAWVSDDSSGTDTSGDSIQARRYDASGSARGTDFQVNTYTTGDQAGAAVAIDAGGNVVVAWTSDGSAETDTSDKSIQAQRYDANGAPLGGQFQVNTYTTGFQNAPNVASDAQGRFVIAWESAGSSGTDTSYASIQARRFDADGVPLGEEFQVNSYTTGAQFGPVAASDAQGNFVIAWYSSGSGGADTGSFSIQARRYDAAGSPVGGDFQVNSYTTDAQYQPDVTFDNEGGFVVSWYSWGSSGTDTSGTSIQAQRFAADGNPSGGQFQVNTFTTDFQTECTVAGDARGNLVFVWTSTQSDGSDPFSESVQGQRFGSNGAPLGGQFQVNSYTTGAQAGAAVTTDSPGNFVVTWYSWGSSGTDANGFSIQAQRFDELFRDGFESGDTSRWTLTRP